MASTYLDKLLLILTENGLNLDDVLHFLNIELYNRTLADRMYIHEHMHSGMNKKQAELQLELSKQKKLINQVLSGDYDSRIEFYQRSQSDVI